MGIKRIMVCLALLGALSSVGDNFVVNPGFEVIDGKDGAVGWRGPSKPFSYVLGEGRNGTRALRFEVQKDSPYVFPSQKVKLVPGESYVAEAWVRTENIKCESGGGAALAAEWRKSDGKWYGGRYSNATVGNAGAFTKISLNFTYPKDAGSFTISPYVAKGCTGKAWFDDISIVPAVRPLAGPVLVSDVYRNTAVFGDVKLSIDVFMPEKERNAKGVKCFFEIPLAEGTSVVESFVKDGCAQTVVDVAALKPGKTRFVFRMKEAGGKVLVERDLLFTRPKAKGPDQRQAKMPSWTVRIERNRTLAGGNPFFPLGVFVSRLDDATIADLKKGAFNCAMAYGSPTEKEMDAAHKAGIKVLYSIKDAYCGTRACVKEISDPESELAWVKDRVKRFKNHPALLAWYINDELGIELRERLVARRNLIEELDPNHPAWVALYQVEDLPFYLGTYDVIGTDPYPICQSGNPPISQVAEHTRMTRRSVFGGMAMWQIPQVFDWGGYRKADVDNTRAPTFEEMRNMQWQFIAEGAMGLVPYAHHSLKKMDWRDKFDVQWKKVCDISREMAAHVPMFLSEEPAVKVFGVPEGVSVRAWHYDGKDWILCVNTTRKQIKGTLDVSLYGKVDVDLAPIGVELKSLTPPAFPEAKEGFMLAAEQRSQSVVVFDGRTQGSHPYVWEWNASRDSNIAKSDIRYFGCTAECKIIPSGAGDSVIMVGSAGGFAEIPLSSGKAVCYGVVNLSPHSVAKLPGDRKYAIASAVSNEITIVDCAASPFAPSKQPRRKYRLWDAHGVEWDAERDCLWGLGKDRIVKYAWHPEKFELEVLTEYLIPECCGMGGHDLLPDGNGNYIFSTSHRLCRFRPDAARFEPIHSERSIKSFSRSSKWGDATVKTREIWWTDRIHIRKDGEERLLGPYPGARFYKARWMK